jgi:hypothetical protein
MNAGEKTLDWLLREQLKIDKPWLLRTKKGFRWWANKNAQKIEIIGKEENPDGDTAYLVQVETDFLRNVEFTDENLAAINELLMYSASMAGPIYDKQSRKLKLCSLVRVYEYIRPWMSALISMASVLQISETQRLGKVLAVALGAEPDESGHPSSGVRDQPDELAGIIDTMVMPMGEQPCKWTEEEFENAVTNYMQRPPTLLATGGGLGFTAEFIFGKGSSLCRGMGDDPHPAYGSGLTLVQSFPVEDCSEEEGAQAALALNRVELTQRPFGYGFGSYCFRDGMIHFTSFIPNMAYRKGLVPNFFAACAGRARELSLRFQKTDWTEETFQIAFDRKLQFLNLLGNVHSEGN